MNARKSINFEKEYERNEPLNQSSVYRCPQKKNTHVATGSLCRMLSSLPKQESTTDRRKHTRQPPAYVGGYDFNHPTTNTLIRSKTESLFIRTPLATCIRINTGQDHVTPRLLHTHTHRLSLSEPITALFRLPISITADMTYQP